MSTPLVEEYFRWLGPQTRDEHGNPSLRYLGLLSIMWTTEFVPLIPYDDNRCGDGVDLRAEFCHDRNLPQEALGNLGPCTFLEVLIGLSRRLAFATGTGNRAPGWAWTLLNNLGLHRMVDPLRRSQQRKVSDILDACIWRTYAPDGQGGFFPLAWPREDQTQVELWYQMSAFIDELHPEH